MKIDFVQDIKSSSLFHTVRYFKMRAPLAQRSTTTAHAISC